MRAKVFWQQSHIASFELVWPFSPISYLLEFSATAHAGLIVLFSPSMTCLLPVYTPFLHRQHGRVDSWDSASHSGML